MISLRRLIKQDLKIQGKGFRIKGMSDSKLKGFLITILLDDKQLSKKIRMYDIYNVVVKSVKGAMVGSLNIHPTYVKLIVDSFDFSQKRLQDMMNGLKKYMERI